MWLVPVDGWHAMRSFQRSILRLSLSGLALRSTPDSRPILSKFNEFSPKPLYGLNFTPSAKIPASRDCGFAIILWWRMPVFSAIAYGDCACRSVGGAQAERRAAMISARGLCTKKTGSGCCRGYTLGVEIGRASCRERVGPDV